MEILTMYSVFYWIAIPSTAIFGILILGSLIGFGDSDLDTDMDVDSDIEGDMEIGDDFPIFTIKNLFAFLTMFSWSGIACIKFGLSALATLSISTGAGIIMIIILSSLFFLMSKLKNENVPTIKDAIGKNAKVYCKIPKNGKGQVSVIVNGSLQTIDAIAKSGKSFDTGESVEVVEAKDTELVVDSVK